MSDSADPDLKGVPSQLGRYQLRFKVASGGMAAVFIARAVGGGSFEKVVAVKTIHPHLEVEGAAVRMFMDEARIASALNHPNVCQVFDYGEQDGVHYLVMEFLFGESLSRLSKRLGQEKDEALRLRLPGLMARIIADAAEGLHAAHELKDGQGQLLEVVHRDVSPQNIFVTYEGAVKVVDFGVARARSRLEQTRAGEFKGKFEYVAPEQVAGKAFDRRVDIWALGVTLWECLTQEKLFRREELAAVFSAIAFDDIPLPSTRAPWVPPALDAIVARALDRDVTKRFQTAREMGRALRQFLASSGEVVESAEVEELMERLFGEDKAKRLKLKDAVLTGSPAEDVAPEPVPSEMSVSQSSQSLSRPRLAPVGAPPRGKSTPRSAMPTAPGPTAPPGPAAPPPQPRRAPAQATFDEADDAEASTQVAPQVEANAPRARRARSPVALSEPDDPQITTAPSRQADAGRSRPRPAAAAPPEAPATSPERPGDDDEEVRLPGRSWGPVIAAAGVAVALLAGGAFWANRRQPEAWPEPAQVEPPPAAPTPATVSPTPSPAATPEPPAAVAPTSADAGEAVDAGAVEDGGAPLDSGVAVDAGQEPPADAGPLPVAGPTGLDAGAEPAAPPPAVPDAGAPLVAEQVVDAGRPTPPAATRPAPGPSTPRPPPVAVRPAGPTPPRPTAPPTTSPTTAPTPSGPTTAPLGTASSTGYVRIKSGEPLEVLIDGRLVGKTPQNLELPVGTHRIEMRVPGTEHGTVRNLKVDFAAEYLLELE